MKLVCRVCKKEFIVSRSKAKCFTCHPHPRQEEIIQSYVSGLPMTEVAKVLSVSSATVRNVIVAVGVNRKSLSRDFMGEVYLDLEWFDGWLLGDGCLVKGSAGNARPAFCCKLKGYMDHVCTNFRRMGFRVGPPACVFDRLREVWRWQVKVGAHPVFTEQYHRWYPEGKKVIPKDCSFSGLALREWYLGDGHLHKPQDCPKLCLGAVSEEEAEFLRSNVERKLGGPVSKYRIKGGSVTESGAIRKDQWQLYVRKRAASTFFDLIGATPVSSYAYKWPP